MPKNPVDDAVDTVGGAAIDALEEIVARKFIDPIETVGNLIFDGIEAVTGTGSHSSSEDDD